MTEDTPLLYVHKLKTITWPEMSYQMVLPDNKIITFQRYWIGSGEERKEVFINSTEAMQVFEQIFNKALNRAIINLLERSKDESQREFFLDLLRGDKRIPTLKEMT